MLFIILKNAQCKNFKAELRKNPSSIHLKKTLYLAATNVKRVF